MRKMGLPPQMAAMMGMGVFTAADTGAGGPRFFMG